MLLKKKYKYKYKFNYVKLIPLLLILVVIIITVGYSTLSDNLAVDSSRAFIGAQSDVRITGLSVRETNNNATSNYETIATSNVSSEINLPNSDSTVSYYVEITNVGNVEIGILDITGLPSNLKYTLSNYNLGAVLCDDNDKAECSLGAVSTVTVTIGYADNGFDSNNTVYSIDMNYIFGPVDYAARIGNNNFTTLQSAIDSVSVGSGETEVVLLKNSAQQIVIEAGKDIRLNIGNLMLSHTTTSIIEVFGTLKVYNGTISSSAAQGAVNVRTGGHIIVSGGEIKNVGQRQAIYNDGGSVTITGNAYIYNNNNQRAAIQNHTAGGTITITGGRIIADRFSAIYNETGTLVIGTPDNSVSTSVPYIQGYYYGVNNSVGTNPMTPTNFDYYDGIIKGKTAAIYDETYIVNKPAGYRIYPSTDVINGTTYKTAYLDLINIITFDPGEGTVTETSRILKTGSEIGTLPVPTRENYVFDGWFTSASGGTEVLPSNIINSDDTYYAHWIEASEVYVAMIGDTRYHTLAEAVSAAPSNIQTTITLIRNTAEKITIGNSKNIVLDGGAFTITNPTADAVITNNGRFSMISGTIRTNSATTSAINFDGISLSVTGGSIIATGLRQAIYVTKGTTTIGGTAYLSSSALVETNKPRATVQNLSGCTLNITGGTIISTNASGIAVTNLGTATIGLDDGVISTTSPEMIGKASGVYNDGTLYYYDGIFKGKASVIAGSKAITINSSTSIVNGTETIDGESYNTAYLESTN